MDSKVRYLSDSEGAANASPIQQPGAYRPQTQMPPPPVNGVQGMDQQTALNNIVNFLNISQKHRHYFH